jgi:hypothetical protein
MKLSKYIDYYYYYEDSITAKELNKGKSWFVVYFGYYTENRYVELFAHSFSVEQTQEAFDLYALLKCEIGHEDESAIKARDRYLHKNTDEVLA